MTPLDRLIADLALAGARLSLVDAVSVRFHAPPGVMTDELAARIRQFKPGLIRALTRESWGRGDGKTIDDGPPNMRRLVFCEAQYLTFPTFGLVSGGREAWIAFCRDAGELDVMTMGLALDDELRRCDKEDADVGDESAGVATMPELRREVA